MRADHSKHTTFGAGLSRRRLLLTGAGLVAAGALPRSLRAQAEAQRLVAGPGRAQVAPAGYPQTDVWAYDGVVPGPTLRLRQGERLDLVVENRLEQPTTIHWHGIRLPNEMDGVAHLTQAPIQPGESFHYSFDCPDAGTFWYHPHFRSFEQVERGLAGALIVEEAEPPQVDRDLLWVLDDWRLTEEAAIAEDFGAFHDISHAGRLGNSATINGRSPEALAVRRGERLRLRLINVANARVFGLDFEGHAPSIIAWDGQPVTPHALPDGRLVLGPGMRADLIIDMTGGPNETFAVTDSFYPNQTYRLVDIAYEAEVLREESLGAVPSLSANPVAEPDLEAAERHDLVFAGGMMGGMTGAELDGRQVSPRELMQHGLAWTVNGVAARDHDHRPMLSLRLGRSYVLTLRNDTAWPHPIHLHGHVFRVLSRNGMPTPHGEWQDTVLLMPQEVAEIAFVADNPGDWMLHCHILEHQLGGMSGVLRVA
ncbi:multicopper oxidase family protein [Aquibaculum sediminis]|uniref:multicopper oxidase family protein n=1 Tax=Aquibaculum sediminis TaxID=3231907 RepID=UPI0034544DD9